MTDVFPEVLLVSCLNFSVGGERDRADDAAISRATAQIAGEPLFDFRLVRVGSYREEISGRDDHPRDAKPALHGTGIDKRLLQRIEPAVCAEPFDRRDRFTVALNRKHETRVDRPAVQENGACAAFTFGAALLRACERQLIAKHIEQRVVWRGIDRMKDAIDR